MTSTSSSRLQHYSSLRIPGSVHDDKLVKRVSVKNRLRNYGQGYALSIAQLAEAEARGAKSVELEERETGLKLHAEIKFFRARAVPIHFRGFEPQLALALSLWRVANPAQPGLFGCAS